MAPGSAGTQLVTDGSGKVAWVASGTIPLQAGEIAVGAGSGVNNNVVPYQDVTLAVDGKTTVVKLQGNPVNAQYPSANQVLTWNGTEWVAKAPSSTLPSVGLETLTYSTPQTHYYSVDPTDFVAINGSYHLNYESPQGISVRPEDSGEVFMAASLHLPHGAVIAQLDFSYLDNDKDDMDFSLVRSNGDGTATTLGTANSNSASASYQSITLKYAETIDNDKYSYKIIIRTKSDNKHRVGRVKVTYTVTKPD